MKERNIGCSWSGGKDSCFTLMKAVESGMQPKVLLNILNENGKISRSHGLTKEILESQAAVLELPIAFQMSTWSDYEKNFVDKLKQLKVEYSLEGFVFGDIDIDRHKEWEEKVCLQAGLTASLPLWHSDRKKLVLEMIASGIETYITSCDADLLGMDYLGRRLDIQLVEELIGMGIDACGENGEFHTVVTDCPLFKAPIQLPHYQKVRVGHYCFLDWQTS